MYHVLLIFLLISAPAAADVIHLKNGRSISVREAWTESGSVKCYRFGALVSYPESQVERIEKTGRNNDGRMKAYLAGCKVLKEMAAADRYTQAEADRWSAVLKASSLAFRGEGSLTTEESAEFNALIRLSDGYTENGELLKAMYAAGRAAKVTWDSTIRRERLGIFIQEIP
jgi:hypothetical protein